MGRINEVFKKTSGKDTGEVIDHDLRNFKLEADRDARIFCFREGNTRVFDICPDVQIDHTPVSLVQGWGVNEPRYRKMKVVVDAGRRVIASHPRRVEKRKESNDNAQYGIENTRKATLLIKSLIQKGFTKTDAIAVSGGAAPALLAALLRPDLFRSMVLVTPAGLNGHMKVSELAKRFAQKNTKIPDLHLRDKSVDMSVLKGGVELVKHVAFNLTGSIREMKELAHIDTYELCQEVSSKGIKISAILATEDNMFPINEMRAHFEKMSHQSGKVVELPFFDIYEMNGNHDEESLLDPVRIVSAVNLLNAMNSV